MLNVITLFSGYDSQCLVLNRLGLPYDLAAWCEIDRHAITAHNALFPQWSGRNLGDVSRVDWAEWHRRHPQPIDLLTYSSPCQDFSSAGLQRGGEEGSGTRSGLLWETERAVRELRPRHLVFENVGGLVSDKFIDLFQRWQVRLNGYGYTNFAQLMNAKDYGVPQNRLRIFMVSILNCPRAYYFPKPFKLERRLKDVLEQNVAERYYLKEEQVEKLVKSIENDNDIQRVGRYNNGQSGLVYGTEGVSPTVDASAPEHGRGVQIAEPQIDILGQLSSSQNSRIIGTEGISPAVINGEKDGMPKITEPQMLGWTRSNTGKCDPTYHPVSVANCVTAAKRDNTQNYIVEPTIAAMRGRDKDNPNDCGESTDKYAQHLELKPDGTSNTITSVAKDNLLIEPSILTPVRTEYGKAIRKQYGDNNLPESRHNLTSLQPKQDGTSNTLTSVAKDNLLIEPSIISPGHGYFEGAINTETSPTVKCSAMQAQHFVSNGIRIRRLTERELYRLMDVDEADIDTLLAAPIPRTQHAKLAGNSIVVACLYHIFRNLFVDTNPAAGVQTMLF